jgi:hypothetical protein
MRVGDWKILADGTLTGFELYDLKSDPREAEDLKDREPERFLEMKERLLRHNATVEAEGPDWWKRLSPNGGKPKGTEGGKGKKGKQP